MTIFERVAQQNGKTDVRGSNQVHGMAFELALALIQLELLPLAHESLNARKLQAWKQTRGVGLRVVYDGLRWPCFNVSVEADAAHDRIVVHCNYWIEHGVEPKASLSLANDFDMVQLGVFIAEFRHTVFSMLNAYTKGEVYVEAGVTK